MIAFVRTALVIAFPFILVWNMAECFCREMRSAFYYVWQEGRISVAEFRIQWNEVPTRILRRRGK